MIEESRGVMKRVRAQDGDGKRDALTETAAVSEREGE